MVRFAPAAGGGTGRSYDADASVGGAIGGVGQRMLAGVTKKTAGQFFTALDQDIAGVLVSAEATTALGAPVAGDAPTASGAVFQGRRSTANANASISMVGRRLIGR